MARLLAPEKDVVVLQPIVALAVGCSDALVLQQIEYWLEIAEKSADKYKDDHFFDGRWWTYDTYNGWREKTFWWLSTRTLERTFSDLEEAGFIIRRDHENRQKGFWVTINYEALNQEIDRARTLIPGGDKMSGVNDDESRQNVATPPTKCGDPEQYRDSTKTTEEQKDSRHTAQSGRPTKYAQVDYTQKPDRPDSDDVDREAEEQNHPLVLQICSPSGAKGLSNTHLNKLEDVVWFNGETKKTAHFNWFAEQEGNPESVKLYVNLIIEELAARNKTATGGGKPPSRQSIVARLTGQSNLSAYFTWKKESYAPELAEEISVSTVGDKADSLFQ